MLALLPILLFAAQTEDGVGGAAPQGRLQVFIAPSGEPFRVHGEVPYPVVDWFSGADKNGDGKVDFAEFEADFLRFFDQLDTNHDGAVDIIEKTRYETSVAPETMGGTWAGESQGQTNADWNSKFSDDVDLPDVDRPSRAPGERPTGGARFDLLGLPEPVAAMDVELHGRVTRRAADDVSKSRFNQLDAQHKGFLTLSELPKTPAENHARGGSHRKSH
jgi:hypothetical protein